MEQVYDKLYSFQKTTTVSGSNNNWNGKRSCCSCLQLELLVLYIFLACYSTSRVIVECIQSLSEANEFSIIFGLLGLINLNIVNWENASTIV